MSDTLRTRIAAVVRREVPCHPPAADRIADAVIRELHPERRCELCGRSGTQKFREMGTGWVCRSIPACERRCRRA